MNNTCYNNNTTTNQGEIMLGYILAFMAYDTVKTVNNKNKKEEKRKKLKQLEWRLSRPMTQGHTKNCVCLLCVNRRKSAVNEHTRLLAEK